MTIRTLEYARELVGRCALSSALSLSLLSLSSVAFAQEEDPFATDTAPADDAAEEEVAEPEAPIEPAQEEEPAVEEPEPLPAEEPEVSEPEDPSEIAGAEVPEPPPGESGPQPPLLALERLPATAYPSDPIPGIRGGSLELAINRLQWPYMPKYDGEPALRIGFSGYSWADSNFRQIKAGQPSEEDQTEYRMQGRLIFRVTPTLNLDNDWFAQTNTAFVANVEQNNSNTNYVDVDEAWVKIGKWKAFDIQVGRMQGFEVYHFGMGMDLNTYERAGAVSFSTNPVQPYGLTDLWDRGVNNGAVALHLFMPKWLKLEFLTRFGLSATGTDIGIRPVGVLDFGFVKLKAGYERRLQASIFDTNDGRIEMQGVAADLQFVLNPWIEFGGGVGQRVRDQFNDQNAVVVDGTDDTVTAGGFLNVRPYFKGWMVGLGYHHTYTENINIDPSGEPENQTHDQMFGALQYLLWDRVYIKYVLSYAKAHVERRVEDPADTGFYNESLSHRLRIMLMY